MSGSPPSIADFPTRPDLIAAAFEAKMLAYADAVAQALAEPDPWVGFCLHLERVCAMQAADQGFTDVLTMTFPTAPGFESERVRAYEGLRRAHRACQGGRPAACRLRPRGPGHGPDGAMRAS